MKFFGEYIRFGFASLDPLVQDLCTVTIHLYLLVEKNFPGLDLFVFNDQVSWLQGNVALDCARILLRSTEELATTDIAEHALVQLRESRIRCTFYL